MISFKKNDLRFLVIICISLSLFSIGIYLIIFGKNGIAKENSSTWGIFGDYIGGIIGTLLSFASVILIYKTYTNQVSISTLQQFESTFFNLVQTHRLTVERYQRRNIDLLNEYNGLQKDRKLYDNLDNKDFFDILYFILDSKYKKVIGKWGEGDQSIIYSEPSVHQKIDDFFKNHYWMIDNYVRSFISIIEYVDRKSLNDPHFYVGILRDMATIDELRMIFYATIWKSNEDGKRWKLLLNKYEIFNFIGDNPDDKKLINPIPDLKAYKEL